jgi:hypothetical protein
VNENNKYKIGDIITYRSIYDADEHLSGIIVNVDKNYSYLIVKFFNIDDGTYLFRFDSERINKLTNGET